MNPAVSLDCSVPVDRESTQNIGTQNSASVLKEPMVFWDIKFQERESPKRRARTRFVATKLSQL